MECYPGEGVRASPVGQPCGMHINEGRSVRKYSGGYLIGKLEGQRKVGIQGLIYFLHLTHLSDAEHSRWMVDFIEDCASVVAHASGRFSGEKIA